MQTINKERLALNVLNSYEKALSNLEELSGFYDGDEISLDEDQLTGERLAELFELQENIYEGQDRGLSPIGAYFADVLEISELGKRSLGGEWITDGIKVLLGFGGPNVWLTIGLGDWATLEVYWGSDKETKQIYLPAISKELWETVEAY